MGFYSSQLVNTKKELTIYQTCVVEEKTELDIRIIKLTEIVFSDKFQDEEKEEQERMERQLYVMMDYSRCLKDRIAAF